VKTAKDEQAWSSAARRTPTLNALSSRGWMLAETNPNS